jgi:hypothetical protein
MKTFLEKLFGSLKPMSDLEKFILSKNPVNAGDVEHWTRVFNHSQYRGL